MASVIEAALRTFPTYFYYPPCDRRAVPLSAFKVFPSDSSFQVFKEQCSLITHLRWSPIGRSRLIAGAVSVWTFTPVDKVYGLGDTGNQFVKERGIT